MVKAAPIFAIDPASQSARMLGYLREVLRARGMRYADVAELLGVSEKSIKRYMTGRGVTLPVLERLCATVGMSMAELSELAGLDDRGDIPWTTDAQEAVLATEPKLAIVLALLTSGWTATRIEREGLASPSDLNAVLIRLDQLGIITLYPHNRTRLLARIRSVDTASEPLRRVITQAGVRMIANLDLTDPNSVWRFNYARLGPASVSRVAQRLNVFLAEVAELSRQDMDLSGEQVRWFAVCGLLAENEVLGLKLLREGDPDDRTNARF
ncbi:helix-turn-helix domain-containing protein [Sphingomonas sp. LH128]|uniref:helix-turn-helix domain-containing protein n=1 Tax=Sphingomonas sp. LH128 TaxID=473781 RepID=UPI00027CC757|nr:helix-turn-helix transcriptional regulator [Sphingomonas sp. LH128]EJU13640.1 helix-turn-helix domain-containing protein [Sphingomonas sp. LH128]